MQRSHLRQMANNTKYTFEEQIKLEPDKNTFRLDLVGTLNDYDFNKAVEDCKIPDDTMTLVESMCRLINSDILSAAK